VLENRASHRRKLSQAFIASIDGATLDAMQFPVTLARFAEYKAAGESLLLEMLNASIIGRKLAIEVADRIP